MERTLLDLLAGPQTQSRTGLHRQDGAETIQVVMIMAIFIIVIGMIFLVPQFGLRDLIVDLGKSVGDKLGIVTRDTEGTTY